MPTSTGLYDTSTITYDQWSLSYDGYPAPLSNMPAVGVYVAFTDGPYVAEPVWTDVSYLTRDVSIRRGRQDDLQQFPSGQCSITFDNRDRYFDPFNTSSPAPFNGNLKPRRQVKVVAVWNGVSYPLFRGFVAGWPVEYTEAGLDSTVTVDCFDLLGLMGRELSASSYCEDYTLSLNPTVFLRCAQLSTTYTESAVSTYVRRYYNMDVVRNTSIYPDFVMSILISDSTSGAQVGSVAQQNSPAAGILTKALQVSSNAGITGSRGFPSLTPTGGVDYSWSCVLAFQSQGTTFVTPFTYSASSLAMEVWIFDVRSTTRAGQIYVRLYLTDGTNISFYCDKRMMDDQAHHYCLTISQSTKTARFYLDGEQIGSTTWVGVDAAVRNFQQYGGGSISSIGQLSYQHFAWWEGLALSADQVATIANFALNYKKENAATRAQFYLNQTPLKAGQYNIDSDMTSQVGEYQLNAQPILPELQRLTVGDDGEMFVDASGVLQLVDGNYYFNTATSNTSQFTFTDSGTGVGYDATSVRYAVDADQVRNTVVVTGSLDFQALSSSSSSITDNGEAGENIDTRLATATDCQTLADRVLSLYKTPKFQLDPFVAKGQQNPSYNWPRLLGLGLLNRVTFKRTPAVGSAVQRDLLVQAIEHRITPGTWETVVNGSTRYTGWFILGTSLLGSSEDVLL